MARPHGSKDKNRRFLENRLKAMFGDDFDPIINAAKQAKKLDKLVEEAEAAYANQKEEDPNEKDAKGPPVGIITASIHAWLKIGEFTHPKLKAMELNLGDDLVDELSDLIDEVGSDPAEIRPTHAAH